MTHVNRDLFATALALLVAAAAGCQSSGRQQAARATESIESLRDDTIQGQAQIDATISALNDLVATTGGDLKRPYESFVREMGRLESTADRARRRADDMRSNADSWVTNWEKQLNAMNNETLRTRAELARAQAQQRFEEIRANAEVAKEAFESLMLDLTDIKQFLDFNLNAAGLVSVVDVVESANVDAAVVNDALGDLVAVLDRVAGAMSSQVGG